MFTLTISTLTIIPIFVWWITGQKIKYKYYKLKINHKRFPTSFHNETLKYWQAGVVFLVTNIPFSSLREINWNKHRILPLGAGIAARCTMRVHFPIVISEQPVRKGKQRDMSIICFFSFHLLRCKKNVGEWEKEGVWGMSRGEGGRWRGRHKDIPQNWQ